MNVKLLASMFLILILLGSCNLLNQVRVVNASKQSIVLGDTVLGVNGVVWVDSSMVDNIVNSVVDSEYSNGVLTIKQGYAVVYISTKIL